MEKSCCELEDKLEMSTSIQYYMELINSKDISSTVVAAIVALVVVFVTIAFWRLITGKRRRRTGILLVGCSDAGKTSLFSQLIAGKHQETQTSFQENEASYTAEAPKGKFVFNLLDLPGHESIRYQYLEKHKDSARGIIFVVDSVTFQSKLQDVAEFLFRIFSDKSISRSSPAICIVCNKQDLLLAKSKRVIFAKLEEELNTLRKTQSAALTSTDGSESSTVFLGKKDKDFRFEHIPKYQIEFLECNTIASEEATSVNVDQLKSWIASLV